MRKNTILLSIVLGVASIASVMAADPVYSVNMVGFVDKQITPRFNLIANPLKYGDNRLNSILPTAPDGAVIYKWMLSANSFQDGITYFDGEWSKVNPTDDDVLAPGDGAFIYVDPESYPNGATLRFIGEVSTGVLTQHFPLNYSIHSNPVPKVEEISTIDLPAVDGDVIYFWNSREQKYEDAITYFEGWDKIAYTEIAGAFFYFSEAATSARTWTRVFTPN